MKFARLAISLLILVPTLGAADLWLGNWVRRPTTDGVSSTMVIEAAGSGHKMTFKVTPRGAATSTMVVTTQADGKDAVVSMDGKPSGETMAIRMIDDRHMINVIKMSGQTMVTQKSELSADGKQIKVESNPSPGGPALEYWDRK